VGPSEEGAFWQQFLRSLVHRGLRGVQLVVSDAHEGLKGAIASVLQGASWQRCRVDTAGEFIFSDQAARPLAAMRATKREVRRGARGVSSSHRPTRT